VADDRVHSSVDESLRNRGRYPRVGRVVLGIHFEAGGNTRDDGSGGVDLVDSQLYSSFAIPAEMSLGAGQCPGVANHNDVFRPRFRAASDQQTDGEPRFFARDRFP
jgi:hypothetical protein